MHRTNIYLTEDQEHDLDQRAQVEGKSRSQLIREILDRELAHPVPGPAPDGALAELAERYHELTGDLFDDDPDLRIER